MAEETEYEKMVREQMYADWAASDRRHQETIQEWCYGYLEIQKKIAARIEREACARICDAQAKEPECPERAKYCAEAIRARSE